MITIRAGKGAIGICLLLLATGCSREQQDWRSAEAADTIEGYGQFIQRHPESELATQARTRVVQLGEDRDWQHAGSADSVEAYREFIAQHPNGKWAQEARIRIENFSLGEQTGSDAASRGAAGNGGASAGGGAGGSAVDGADLAGAAAAGSAAGGLATPGEAAVPVAGADAAGASIGRPGGAMSANGVAAGGTAARGAGAAGAGAGGAAAGGMRGGGFGIQLGAFSSEAAANNEWRVLTGRFGPELQGLNEHVVTADTPSGRVYRLQAVVGDEARARAICDSLRKRSQGCVAVLPH
jgi:SPOR domain